MTELLADFLFLRPLWLIGIPVAVIVVFHRRRQQSRGGWSGLIESRFIPMLRLPVESSETWSPLWWLLPTTLACIALAGPSWQALPGTAAGNRQAMIIALDLSPSMLAADIQPSRLALARHKLIDLLRARREGETAVLVYAGTVHQVTPLTEDTEVIINLVETLEPAIMPAAGSRAEDAVARAQALLEKAGLTTGDILLLTDGLDDQAVSSIKSNLSTRYRLSILAVGTEKGAPFPGPEGSYQDDAAGNVIVARVDSSPLIDLVKRYNGRFSQTRADSSDIEYLASLPPLPFRARVDADIQNFDSRHDAGYWLCLLLLPASAWLFRRQLIFVLLPIVLIPQESRAWEWRELWLTPEQNAQQLLKRNPESTTDYEFKNPHWQAIALYRAGKYEQVVTLLQNEVTADSLYNLGNAQARLGLYQEALESYERSLATSTDASAQAPEDLLFNHALVTQLLEAQNREQEEQINPDDENSEQNEDQGGDGNDSDTSQEDSEDSDVASSGEQAKIGGNTGDGQSLNQRALQEQGTSSTANADEAVERDNAQDATPVNSGLTDTSATEEQGTPADTMASRFEQNDNTVLNPYSEQWLRSLPQDPGGYLRRKFQYQYQLREAETPSASSEVRY